MAYTTIDDPSAYFQTVLYTGNEAARTITNDGNSNLQPDWIWNKGRDHAHYHYLTDTTRGLTKYIYSNAANAEETFTTYVTNTTSDGFTLGNGQGMNDNTNVGGGVDYVTWQWKANGGTRTTYAESGNNPAGGYQVNTTAGFSIVDYTGTGAAGTLAHGLGVAPEWIIIKGRNIATDGMVYHGANTSAPGTDALTLPENSATSDNAGWWNDTAPTSSVFTLGNHDRVNKDGSTYIAYVFAPKQGYSKFGSYTGNGNADGTFVYTGFKPAWVMSKETGSTGNWIIHDTTRDPGNGSIKQLKADTDEVEYDTGSDTSRDILSNGFKQRYAGGSQNGDGDTHVYMAFAENPFVTSTGIPTTAR
jgi:hypothetical protein